MLPVDAVRDAFDALDGPVVLTAPPGSGKSTRVPLWCTPPVLVVQPRRVAARSLADHLGKQGHTVGYAVRGESRATDADCVFVTPGVALRMLARDNRFATVVLDEFHERSLDLDLLLALVHADATRRLVVLSATLQGDRLAEHLDGTHLTAAGRMFPVEVRYASSGRDLPTEASLGARVRSALASLDAPGDRLVFVPGRAEMGEVVRALASDGDEIMELHGGLTLADQNRVFKPGSRRRVVVATNVAETSLTLPNIGAVIDTGLVRRTHYHQDRGYLQLGPIAMDSADQRAGRAGRLGPGVAIRLWGERAPLRDFTPPELQRESLVPLVLAAAAAGHASLDLPFLDAPADHAVETARDQLCALGALSNDGITERGRRLFQLPMDAHIAHLLVVAEQRDHLAEAIDLAAALSTTRRLFLRRADPEDEADVRNKGCDVSTLIWAVRDADARRDGLSVPALMEVRREAKRLRKSFGEPNRRPFDRLSFARILVEAWPTCAHVARRRGQKVRWSNGGTEVALGNQSAVRNDVEALLAVDFRALGRDRLSRELKITVGLPITLRELGSLGLGRPRAGDTTVERKRGRVRIETVVERVYAGTVVHREPQTPSGELLREVLAQRLIAGQVWKGFARRFGERKRLVSLQRQFDGEEPLPDDEDYVRERLSSAGLETLDELQMLSESDLLPPELDPSVAEPLERDFPAEIAIGNVKLRVEVHPKARVVVLHNLGARLKKPPPTAWLPSFRGFRVVLEDRGKRKDLR